MHKSPHARSGFTLIELLAVIVILSILIVVLVPRLAGFGERANEKATKAFLAQLDVAIAEYENRFGDYPPSHFPDAWGAPPNTTNLGGEALVVSLWSKDWGGTGLAEDKLMNSDGDATKKPLATFPNPDLFELKDSWGNPIAYLHRRDYTREDVYVSEDPETGEQVESTLKAKANKTTGGWQRATKYQLVSAGADGRFGTDDDVGNFESTPETEE
jgi:prepilin-type N-terminal cleavage/methylation domain-containing protein